MFVYFLLNDLRKGKKELHICQVDVYLFMTETIRANMLKPSQMQSFLKILNLTSAASLRLPPISRV